MSDSSVIREFLVSLGFKVDDASHQKFQKGLDAVTVKAVALGEVIADVAEKVARGVLQMAQSLDTLYFVSRRVGDSAENISAFGFAISQMGGNAANATATLESLAAQMRQYPGLLNALKGWGVQTTDAKGNQLGMTQILVNLGRFWAAQKLRLGQDATGEAQAQMLGISDAMYLQLSTDPDRLSLEMAKYKQFADSLGYNADEANRFETSMRDLKAELWIFASAVGLKVMDTLQGIVDKFKELFPQIVKVAGTKDLVQLFSDAVVAALSAVAIATIAAMWPWLLLAAAILAAIEVYRHWNEIVPKIHKLTPQEQAASDKAKADSAKKNPYSWYDPRGWFNVHKAAPTANSVNPADPGSFAEPGKNFLGSSTSIKAQGSRAALHDQVKTFFMANGFSEAQAEGIARGVYAEGGGVNTKNPTSSAYGIGQWTASSGRQADFKRIMGKDIHGSSLQDQLAFMLWEFNNTYRRAGNAIRGDSSEWNAFQDYITKMMIPGSGTAGDLARGGLLGARGNNVTIHNRTDIKIEGASDPRATAGLVAASQERTLGNALRNARSVAT